jgi:Family of unknown function (DUF5670)
MRDLLVNAGSTPRNPKEFHMFITIAIVLVVLWLLGFVVFHVSSFLIHILLLVAVISLIWHFVAGRRGAP